jgi:hypothetical protein
MKYQDKYDNDQFVIEVASNVDCFYHFCFMIVKIVETYMILISLTVCYKISYCNSRMNQLEQATHDVKT